MDYKEKTFCGKARFKGFWEIIKAFFDARNVIMISTHKFENVGEENEEFDIKLWFMNMHPVHGMKVVREIFDDYDKMQEAMQTLSDQLFNKKDEE